MTAAPLRLAFMGSPDFAVPALRALVGRGAAEAPRVQQEGAP